MSIEVLQTQSQTAETEQAAAASQSAWLRFAKEPLLHFILAGAAIYLLYGVFGGTDSDQAIVAENTIVITKGELDWLGESWQKRWNRPPTNEEMVGLVKSHLRETVLYREAISMGLDKDDTIIRRRLAQKLEFLSQDLIRPEPPTDEALHAFFDKNIDRYRLPELITFTHVYLDPDKREDQTLDDAEKLKAELIANDTIPGEESELGDTFMLQSYYPERTEADISKLFGREFARSIMKLDPKRWHGPVLSGYGTHLVYLQSLQVFPNPIYDQVADRVREDLESERRQQLNDEYIESLLSRYDVVIEAEDSDDLQAVSMEMLK